MGSAPCSPTARGQVSEGGQHGGKPEVAPRALAEASRKLRDADSSERFRKEARATIRLEGEGHGTREAFPMSSPEAAEVFRSAR
jgi:hypothetical protein